jgi:hypothetical protein
MYQSNQTRIKKEKTFPLTQPWVNAPQSALPSPRSSSCEQYRGGLSPLDPNSLDNKMLQYVFIAHYFNSGAPNPELNTALVLGGV